MDIWLLGAGFAGIALCSYALGRRSIRPIEAAKTERAGPDPSTDRDDDPRERLYTARRDFVANVSHELRTPVSIVKGFAETLDDDYEEIPGKTRREFIRKIRRNSDRLGSLVEDLLQLAELESPGYELRLENRKLAETARAVAGRFEEHLDGDAQRIVVDLAEETQDLPHDPVKIERVFENLLSNSLKYASGFSIITIRTRVTEDNRAIVCEVEDDGCGIPSKDLPHVFERFYRVDKGRSRESGGTGLGLSIVKHIVEMHRGSVDVRSEVDKGTGFSFTLPYGS